MKKNKNFKDKEIEGEQSKVSEYGVVLKKGEKFQYRIYPQKGKVPKDDDSYKIV